MIEIKVDHGHVKEYLCGDASDILAELSIIVRCVTRTVAKCMEEHGEDEETLAKLQTAINLSLIENVAEGIGSTDKMPDLHEGGADVWND